MNRVEDYIQKLEKWNKMCREIIDNSCDLTVSFRAIDLNELIEEKLEYYKNILKTEYDIKE